VRFSNCLRILQPKHEYQTCSSNFPLTTGPPFSCLTAEPSSRRIPDIASPKRSSHRGGRKCPLPEAMAREGCQAFGDQGKVEKRAHRGPRGPVCSYPHF